MQSSAVNRVSMNETPHLGTSVEDLQTVSNIAKIGTKSFMEENARIEALSLAKKLVASLQTPEEVVLHYAWETASHRMALRLGVDLGLFRILVDRSGESVSAIDIGNISHVETQLIVRIMRVLSAIGFVTELDRQLYTANGLTGAIATPSLAAATKIMHDNSAQVEMNLHNYFRTHGYTCPTDGANCAFQWTFNTNLTYFQRIHSSAETLHDFNTFMAGYRNKHRHWVDWFPVEAELFDGFIDAPEKSGPLIVDVGGGNGHDLERFIARFPQAKDHLVLQDLTSTVAELGELHPGIKAMAHDFFTPQPVRGARAYYTHDVLHDWPDDKCREILRHLMTALRPAYSKILLNESILPDKDCPSYWAAGDINMMAILAGKKRTRSDWIEIIQSVGFTNVRIWNSPFLSDEEGIIEITL
ncbi:MAG: hypothetical protein M1820_010349 [Bogoriella megaspora]|nr:MAG: hypothetical protein M1820_010349 [Bogoriella megaspora]